MEVEPPSKDITMLHPMNHTAVKYSVKNWLVQ